MRSSTPLMKLALSAVPNLHVLAFHVLVVALAAGLGSLAPRLPALRRLARRGARLPRLRETR